MLKVLKKLDILNQLSHYLSLEPLMKFFFEQINQICNSDGKILFLLENDNAEQAKVYLTEFTSEFAKMQEIWNNAQYPLQSLKMGQKCVIEKKTLYLTKEQLENSDEFNKKWVEYWGIQYIFYFPIYQKDSAPLGFMTLFITAPEYKAEEISRLEDLIGLFYSVLKRTLKIEKAYLDQKEIDIANSKYKKFLELLSHINILTNAKDIYKKLIFEMIQIFGFEIGFIQIEKEGRLPIVFGVGNSDEMNRIAQQEFDYFGKLENAHQIYPILNPEGGACCMCFLNNTHFYIYDAQHLFKLPMTVKDKFGIEMIGLPLKSFAQIPIRAQEKPVGILQLWSVHQNIVLKEDDIELITHVCSFLPSILNNAELHIQVERRKNELQQKNTIIQEKNFELLDELKLARQIQQKLVPQKSPSVPRLEIASLYKPMEQIGGDYFDFYYDVPNNLFSVFISDVSGHGVPAALITTMLKTLLQVSISNRESPANLLAYINDKITGQTNNNFITAFYAQIDVNTLEMKYARASHNYPYLIRRGEIIELASKGKILGMNMNITFEEKTMALEPGDRLLFYTDGLTETINSEKIEFGENLPQLMLQFAHLPIGEFIERIYSELLHFSEKYHFDDDVCMIGLEIK